MSLSESKEFSSATVRESGYVEVRIDTVVRRGDQELARVPHRHVLSPGDDLSSQDPRVAAIAKAAWTPEVLAAHEERLAESERLELERQAKAAAAEKESDTPPPTQVTTDA
jgi:hypothetical protein